jgi:hypothetical protein
VRLVSPSNVARLALHPKFVWVFNANYDGTIIYNDPVFIHKYFARLNVQRYVGTYFITYH